MGVDEEEATAVSETGFSVMNNSNSSSRCGYCSRSIYSTSNKCSSSSVNFYS